MFMFELENQKVKLSANSITVKDENGKTKGVVRSITSFTKLPMRTVCEWSKKMRECDLLGCSESKNLINNVIYDGRSMYYLNNLKPIKFYEETLKGIDGYEDEKRSYEKRLEVAEKAKKYMTVIDCYII